MRHPSQGNGNWGYLSCGNHYHVKQLLGPSNNRIIDRMLSKKDWILSGSDQSRELQDLINEIKLLLK